MAFGSPVQTIYKYDLADRVLTLDKDIFSDFNVRYKKDYSKRKNLPRREQADQSTLFGRNDDDADRCESRSQDRGKTESDA